MPPGHADDLAEREHLLKGSAMSNDAKPSVNGKHDLLTHRIVVISLGAFILFTGLNVTVLTLMGKEVPQALPAMGYMALGAFCTMLANIMKEPR